MPSGGSLGGLDAQKACVGCSESASTGAISPPKSPVPPPRSGAACSGIWFEICEEFASPVSTSSTGLPLSADCPAEKESMRFTQSNRGLLFQKRASAFPGFAVL